MDKYYKKVMIDILNNENMKDINKIERLLAILNAMIEQSSQTQKTSIPGIALQANLLNQKTKEYL